MYRIFEWDEVKATSNFRKHGVRFEAAALAFDDPLAKTIQDRIENGEMRWLTLGMVHGVQLLLAAEIVRIISARRPTKQEKRNYENS
jgi:uncharacterized protein